MANWEDYKPVSVGKDTPLKWSDYKVADPSELPNPEPFSIGKSIDNFFTGTMPAATSNLVASTAGLGQLAIETFHEERDKAPLAKWFAEKAEEARNHAILDQWAHPSQNYAGEIVDMSANSMALMAPSVIASVLTANPAVGLALMGGLTSGEAYHRYRQKGYTPDQAFAPAVTQGAIEVGTEALPFGTLVKMGLGKSSVLKSIGKLLIQELPGESVATALQNSVDKYVDNPSDSTEQKRQKLQDYWSGIFKEGSEFRKDQMDTFFTTLLTTGAMSGTAFGAGYKTNKNILKSYEGLVNEAKKAPELMPLVQVYEQSLEKRFADSVWEPKFRELQSIVRSTLEGTDTEIDVPEAKTTPTTMPTETQQPTTETKTTTALVEQPTPEDITKLKTTTQETPTLESLIQEETKREDIPIYKTTDLIGDIREAIKKGQDLASTFQELKDRQSREEFKFDDVNEEGKPLKLTKGYIETLWKSVEAEQLTTQRPAAASEAGGTVPGSETPEAPETKPVAPETPVDVPGVEVKPAEVGKETSTSGPTSETVPALETVPTPEETAPVPESVPETAQRTFSGRYKDYVKRIFSITNPIDRVEIANGKGSQAGEIYELAIKTLSKLRDSIIDGTHSGELSTEDRDKVLRRIDIKIRKLHESYKVSIENLKSNSKTITDGETKLKETPLTREQDLKLKFGILDVNDYEFINNDNWAIAKSLNPVHKSLLKKVSELYNFEAPLVIDSYNNTKFVYYLKTKGAYMLTPKNLGIRLGTIDGKSYIILGEYGFTEKAGMPTGDKIAAQSMTLFHELAHYAEQTILNQEQNGELREALHKAHQTWIESLETMPYTEFMKYRYHINEDTEYYKRIVEPYKDLSAAEAMRQFRNYDYNTSFEEFFAYSSASYFFTTQELGTPIATLFQRTVNIIKSIWKIFNEGASVPFKELHRFWESIAKIPQPEFRLTESIYKTEDLWKSKLLTYIKTQGEMPTWAKAQTVAQGLTKDIYEEVKQIYDTEIKKVKAETPVTTFVEPTIDELSYEYIKKQIYAVLLKGDNRKGLIVAPGKNTGQLSLYISGITKRSKEAKIPANAALLEKATKIYNLEISIKTPGKAEYTKWMWVTGAMMEVPGKTKGEVVRLTNDKDIEDLIKIFLSTAQKIREGKSLSTDLEELLGISKPKEKSTFPAETYVGNDGKQYSKRELAEKFGGGVAKILVNEKETGETTEHKVEVGQYDTYGSELDKIEQRQTLEGGFNFLFNPVDKSIVIDRAELPINPVEIDEDVLPIYEDISRAQLDGRVEDVKLLQSEANSIEFNQDTTTPNKKEPSTKKKQLSLLEELERWALAQGKTIEQVWIEKGGTPEAFERLMESAGEAWLKRQNKKNNTRVQTLQARAIGIGEKLETVGSKFYQIVSAILDRESTTPKDFKNLSVDDMRKVVAFFELLYQQKTGEKFKYDKRAKRTKVIKDITGLKSIQQVGEDLWLTGAEVLEKTETGRELNKRLWSILTGTDSHAGQLLSFLMLNEKYIQEHNDRLLRMYIGEEEFDKSLEEHEKFDIRKYKNINPELDKKILAHMKMVYDTIGKMMEQRMVVVSTFDGRKTIYVHDSSKPYFPHTFRPEDLSETSTKYKTMLKGIQKNYGLTAAEAKKLLDRFIKQRNASKKFGNMEYARDFDSPGWIRDIMQVTSLYTVRGLKRLYSIDQFGKKSEKAVKLLYQMEQEGGDYNRGHEIVQQIVGYTNQEDLAWRKFADLATSYEILTKMGLSMLSNVSQPINILAVSPRALFTTFGKMLRGMTREEAQTFAYETGAMLGTVLKEYVDFQRGENISDLFLRKTGFTYVEVKNRIFAAVAGREAARDAFKTLKKTEEGSRANRKARVVLKTLGLDVDTLLSQDKLTDADEHLAGLNMANKTQFRSNGLTLPRIITENPKARLLVLLHTFSYHQAKLISDTIKHRKPNMIPLVIGMLVSGAGLDWLKRFLKGRKQAEDPMDFILGALSNAGGFGLLFDFVRASASGADRLLSALAGPFISDIANVSSSMMTGFAKGIEWVQGDADFTDVVEKPAKELLEASPAIVAKVIPGQTGQVLTAVSSAFKGLLKNYLWPTDKTVFD